MSVEKYRQVYVTTLTEILKLMMKYEQDNPCQSCRKMFRKLMSFRLNRKVYNVTKRLSLEEMS